MVFENPSNGYRKNLSACWFWVLLFGVFYFAIKGVWTHVFAGILLGIITVGFSWLIYPFFASGIMRNHYLTKGWIEIR